MSKSMIPLEEMYSIPKGFRFRPSDQELLLYYLQRKIQSIDLPPNIIHEVDLYKYGDPESLTEKFWPVGEKDNKWYFVTKIKRKHLHGTRFDRMTGQGEGRWKLTATPTIIMDGVDKIGKKRTLCYEKFVSKEFKKTNWIMHEYSMMDSEKETINDRKANDKKESDIWVLCGVYYRPTKGEAYEHPALPNIGNIDGPSQAAEDFFMNDESTAQVLPPDISHHGQHLKLKEHMNLSPAGEIYANDNGHALFQDATHPLSLNLPIFNHSFTGHAYYPGTYEEFRDFSTSMNANNTGQFSTPGFWGNSNVGNIAGTSHAASDFYKNVESTSQLLPPDVRYHGQFPEPEDDMHFSSPGEIDLSFNANNNGHVLLPDAIHPLTMNQSYNNIEGGYDPRTSEGFMDFSMDFNGRDTDANI